MTNANSKMIEMFNEKSIARGNEWFKANAFNYFEAENSFEKTRLLNIRGSVLNWVKGDYTETINISFKKGEITLDRFHTIFQATYGMLYCIMWKYSNVEKCEDLMDVFKQTGFVLRRQRCFGDVIEFHFGIFTIETAETAFMFKNPASISYHLCDCGCDEYQPKMKKTLCCGRRYVNIVHQRCALVNKKCPCKANN